MKGRCFAHAVSALALTLSWIAMGCGRIDIWNKTMGGNYKDTVSSVQQTMDGGYIVVGETFSFSPGKLEVWLIKINGNGDQQWNKTFGGERWDGASSVSQTKDGGYIVAGGTSSYGAGNWDMWLIKTDGNGNEQWNKTFGGKEFDYASSVQQTTDGGYIVIGDTFSYGAGNRDIWLIKTDPSGNEQWNKTFGGSNAESGFSVRQTMDGGFILAGRTYSYGAGNSDAWLIKTDNNGSEQWEKTFGGTEQDIAYSVSQTTDGGYILTGGTMSYGAGNLDVWLIKTDAHGNALWSKTFGGAEHDWAYSVAQTMDGGYIIVGATYSYGAGDCDAWLIKTDGNGNEQWDKTYGGGSRDLAYSVAQTTDHGYIMAGETYSFGTVNGDAWLIKTDENGNAPPYPSQ